MSFMPYANWEAIVLVVIAFSWYQHKQVNKLNLVESAQSILKAQLEDLNEKLRIYEFVIQENKIREKYELSDKRHPEMYTDERLPVIGKPYKPGWINDFKAKPEFEKQIEESRQILITEMTNLRETYRGCLQPGFYTEFKDENFWLWFTPNFKHPYYYASWFMRTGKNDWKPPDIE